MNQTTSCVRRVVRRTIAGAMILGAFVATAAPTARLVEAQRSPGTMTMIVGPANTTEIILVSAVNSNAVGYFQVLPCDEEPGSTSNLNVSGPDQTASALAVVTYDGRGTACVFSSGGAALVVDRQGQLDSFDSSSRRLLDTRESTRVAAGSLTPLATLPRSNALLSVVALRPSGRGFVQILPCDEAPGSYASLNVDAAGRTTSNSVFYESKETDTEHCVYSTLDTHVVVDIVGSDMGFVGGEQRLIDTRSGLAVAAGQTRVISGPPGASSAVAVSMVRNGRRGYVQILPCGATPGGYASLVVDAPGRTVTGSAVGTFPESGELCVYSSTDTHVVIDLQGTLAGFTPQVEDQRSIDTRSPSDPGSMTLERTLNTPLDPGTCGWISEYLEDRLVNGSAPNLHDGPENMTVWSDVAFSDVNGDGAVDSAYSTLCNGGGSASWNALMVHYAGDNTPTEVDYSQYSTGSIERIADGISFIIDVSIAGDLMRLEWESPRFGPLSGAHAWSLYRIDGDQLTLLSWDYER